MSEYNKREQTHRYRKQTSGYYWGEEEWNNPGVELKIQTIRCNISYKDTYCITWGIQPSLQ